MSAGRVSDGPVYITEVEIHTINEAFRILNERIDKLTGLMGPIQLYDTLILNSNSVPPISGIDASNVTYTPSDNANWDGGADPGNVDDALDQLAERTTDLEAGGGGGSGGGPSAGTPEVDGHPRDAEIDNMPWETVQLYEDTMAMYEQADGNAIQLKALQVVVVGDELVGDLQPVTDGFGNLVYA